MTQEIYWQSKSVQLGNVKRNTSRKIEFKALPSMPGIKNIITTCGCTKAKYDIDTRTLSVVYNAGEIPRQVEGNQTILKNIILHYSDGQQDTLQISGVKTR